ncbi:chemotaxis protein CheA [Paracoccus onubensis]|uniref:chemotaxis protein CheA n=1 Tax=Paracoccus onubensis TaxID=1675788 RepID=UPI00272F64BB|nr:chemotaxis protein CheA [Paracoccus onubensis]MDP0928313.1 chemotaxis protein CheA [Paracoccus onubensis]
MDDINPAIGAFVQEAQEILEGLEDLLLDLEDRSDPEQIDAVFRTLHTVKGSGAMFGFGTLARFTHHFEDAFDRIRAGRLSIDGRLIDLSLRARDHMIALLNCGGDGPQATALEESPEAIALLAALFEITGAEVSRATGGNAAAEATSPVQQHGALRRWLIRFVPEVNALRNGMRPDLLLEELGGLGQVDISADIAALPGMDELEPTRGYLGWTATLETDQPKSAIEAVFIFADDAELAITEEMIAPPPKVDPESSEDEPPSGKVKEKSGESVRVPAVKLDEIMDQLGELVIAQARLSQMASADAELESVVEEIERLVTGLRDATLSIRMLPIEIVFGKFRRVVRDLSTELGKVVTLITEGGETEIDKTVIDRLSEPLVHMIRNSMDHGIESAEARAAAGKPSRGTVRLSARQEGGEVLITIEDDGAGLDAEAIRFKAIERGLLSSEAQPTESELFQLIFAPGFSTAKQVSSVSGRGVGMDAVRSTVDALRGSIEVASRRGTGTRVTLRLPVTLAIIDGLLVRLGNAVFVIPLAAVEECVELDAAERERESGRTMLCIREHLVPFLDLDEVFGWSPSVESPRRVVIVKFDGQRLGLVVDDILGQNQTVIKTFSQYHRDVPGFAGATILGDGSVALIIDVATLARRALAERAERKPAA